MCEYENSSIYLGPGKQGRRRHKAGAKRKTTRVLVATSSAAEEKQKPHNKVILLKNRSQYFHACTYAHAAIGEHGVILTTVDSNENIHGYIPTVFFFNGGGIRPRACILRTGVVHATPCIYCASYSRRSSLVFHNQTISCFQVRVPQTVGHPPPK